ncbi:MAG: hypothetical protein ACFFER_08225 [Candidatus Thorarchaeota archaeon]
MTTLNKMSFRGPSDIPFKEVVICIILLVGLGLIISAATNPNLTPEMRGWSLIGGALLIIFLLGGSAKLSDLV